MKIHLTSRTVQQLLFVFGLLRPRIAAAHVGDLVSREPTDADLQLIQQQIDQARSSLSRLRTLPISVPGQKRQELDRRIARADAALKRYEDLVKHGKPRKRAQGFFYAASAILVLDDASLVGTADNVLLPIVALGTLATKLLTYGPPSLPELAGAWKDVTTAMEAAGQEAERVKQEATRMQRIPDRKDCGKHYERCQDTYLGKPNSASWGQSICAACFDQCRDKKFWPDMLDSQKPCQWWDWLDTAPTDAAPKRRAQ